MGIFEKFKSGFKKSASAFTTGLRDIVVKKEIDDKTLDKIEDYLIQSDVGIVSASEIREIISQTKIDPNKDLTDEINNILKNYIISIMKPLENIEFFKKKEKLNATLISGVNGVGKTTTIGKLAHQFKQSGKKVVLGAASYNGITSSVSCHTFSGHNRLLGKWYYFSRLIVTTNQY